MEIQDLTAQLGTVLKSTALENALRKAMMDSALKTGKIPGIVQLTDAEQAKLAKALASAAAPVFEKGLEKAFTDSAQYKQIEKKFKELKVALQHSPLGVWVDKEKSVLIVTGMLVVIGGAAALFVTKTGGPAVDLPIGMIKGKRIELWQMGSFKLGAKLLEFQPQHRTIGLEVIGEQKWQRLDISLGLGVLATGPTATKINGEATVTVDNSVTVSATASYNLPNRKTMFGLSVKPTGSNFDLKLNGVMTGDKLTGGGLTASENFKDGTVTGDFQGDGKELRAMVFLNLKF